MTSETLWYANRATGAACLVLFTVVVLLGIAVRLRGKLPGLPRFGTVTLHRTLSLSATAFLALHVAAAVIDGYVDITPLDALVPFVSGYQPLWLGLGTVALDLMLAVLVTSLLRARLGHRTWRAVHWLAYASWPIALVHGIGIGTDTGAERGRFLHGDGPDPPVARAQRPELTCPRASRRRSTSTGRPARPTACAPN
ncbi:ferric reductase-like transmembrane domain-containing protein [Streptomyces sp. ADMS]|uniref:ferric reductase-like transmembrane domain-containing protein n=1 Tax=Streptomyces sp. ADMS TaxID=3071415 RepID=UPI00296F77EF|nr:ferric reductase-like transmembrane domain-containing protein [Streptomyces sp. ADMS]MDW4909211.1 ferric reductase-like transmembrane domain-containing protein [Streptomyces sp. ADMS]